MEANEAHKKILLIEINNQCSEVQRIIAIDLDSSEHEKIICELLKLRELLEEFLGS